jgi:hypothetical protein
MSIDGGAEAGWLASRCELPGSGVAVSHVGWFAFREFAASGDSGTSLPAADAAKVESPTWLAVADPSAGVADDDTALAPAKPESVNRPKRVAVPYPPMSSKTATNSFRDADTGDFVTGTSLRKLRHQAAGVAARGVDLRLVRP